jgi:hypothetical protein
MLIFILGSLLGILLGGFVCARYLRQEIAAGVGPKLKRLEDQIGTVESQLRTIESQLSLVIETRYAELYASLPAGTSRQISDRSN